MRNSSLVEWHCTEDVPGLSILPKLRIYVINISGRGAFQQGRRSTEKTAGLVGSENAGMSSARRVRIPSTVCLRVPGSSSSSQGKSGPKARPKGVADGQQVYIPVLLI